MQESFIGHPHHVLVKEMRNDVPSWPHRMSNTVGLLRAGRFIGANDQAASHVPVLSPQRGIPTANDGNCSMHLRSGFGDHFVAVRNSQRLLSQEKSTTGARVSLASANFSDGLRL